jgi:cytochrome c553
MSKKKRCAVLGLATLIMLVPLADAVPAVKKATSAFPPGSTARDLTPLMPSPPTALAFAYPVSPPGLPRPDPNATFVADGADPSSKLTMRQINDGNNPPDWFPKEHAPMPDIARHGLAPHIAACIQCHLPNGNGHPESASISGLSVDYIVKQTHAFRDGERLNIRSPAMIEIAMAISDKELREAAQYFSRIPRSQQKWIRVVETSRAPATHLGGAGVRFFDKGGETVAVPQDMIFEVAESEQIELRNDHFGFADYVPQGSIAKGRVVSLGNRGQFRACSSCHGEDFRGHDDAPRLAGRSAYYSIRQLADMKDGARKGEALGKMKDIIGKLSDADIINVAAFMASRTP